jgi:tRNA G46 methylase TrmB
MRRVVDEEFLQAIYRGLIEGGEFWIKTDHESYFQQISKAAIGSGLWSPTD